MTKTGPPPLDGQPVEVQAAGYLLGVEVPAGAHLLTLTYTQPGAGAGLALSILGLVLTLGLAFRRRGARPCRQMNPTTQKDRCCPCSSGPFSYLYTKPYASRAEIRSSTAWARASICRLSAVSRPGQDDLHPVALAFGVDMRFLFATGSNHCRVQVRPVVLV